MISEMSVSLRILNLYFRILKNSRLRGRPRYHGDALEIVEEK